MTSKTTEYKALMTESSLIAQDLQKLVAASRKNNDDSLDACIAGSFPPHQSFPMSNKPKKDSERPSDTTGPTKELERAVSATVAAGRRTEASGKLVVTTFPSFKQAPMLPSQNNRATPTLPLPMKSTPKLVNLQYGKEYKQSQPKTTKKRPCNDEHKKEKKQKFHKGPKSAWNFFYSDFVKANSPHLKGDDLLAMGSNIYKSLTQEEKAHYQNLAAADRERVLALTKSQSSPKASPSLMNAMDPTVPLPSPETIIGTPRTRLDQGPFLQACHPVDSSKTPPETSSANPLPAPITPAFREEKKPKSVFLPAGFHVRPPVDPLCTLPHFGSSDLQENGNIGGDGKLEKEADQKQTSFPLQENGISSWHQANPYDIANHLLCKFLNQYGLFWPFQYWILNQMQSSPRGKINSDSRHRQGALPGCNLPIHEYYHDPNHPFRKFFHPCSSTYLSAMEHLADILARRIEVLDAFRSLARDVALMYPFFRDGLHYVLQHADAKAFQPLLGVPECHMLSVSEGIYYSQRS